VRLVLLAVAVDRDTFRVHRTLCPGVLLSTGNALSVILSKKSRIHLFVCLNASSLSPETLTIRLPRTPVS